MNTTAAMIVCSGAALTLAVCVYLFFSVKRDLHVLEARYLRRGEDLRSQLKEIAEELETVRQELEIMGQKQDPTVAVAHTLGSGMRIQALRMIKHGQGPEHISAVLGLPRNQVELLIKVQRLIADQPAAATS
jgi:hypothetical protein